MHHDRIFDHAVTLAAGFIANGDIRLANTTRPTSQAMDVTRDLIESLYERLAKLDAELRPAVGSSN